MIDIQTYYLLQISSALLGPRSTKNNIHGTVSQINQKPRQKYCSSIHSICSFAGTAHLWDSERLDSYSFCGFFFYSGP